MRRVPVVPRTSSFRRSSRSRRASASISQNLQNNKRKSTKDNFQIIISLFIPFSIFSDLTFCMFFYHSSPHFLDFSDPWKHRVANTWLEIGIIGMCLVAFVAFVAAPEEGQRSYECIRHLEVTNLCEFVACFACYHVVAMLWCVFNFNESVFRICRQVGTCSAVAFQAAWSCTDKEIGRIDATTYRWRWRRWKRWKRWTRNTHSRFEIAHDRWCIAKFYRLSWRILMTVLASLYWALGC